MTLGNDLGYKCTLLIPLLRHKLILTYYKTKDTFILIINPFPFHSLTFSTIGKKAASFGLAVLRLKIVSKRLIDSRTLESRLEFNNNRINLRVIRFHCIVSRYMKIRKRIKKEI